MPQVTLINCEGHAQRAAVQGPEAEDLLWAAGVECGGWAPRREPVSSLPQLSYARELLALERRFGTVMTQRLRVATGAAWKEPGELHVHETLELRVVVRGALRLSLGAMTLGGWLQVEVSACEWVGLPAHLPYAAAPDRARGLDLLCLFTQAGGQRARATGSGPVPGRRQRPPTGQPLADRSDRPDRQATSSRDSRWQPAAAA